MTFVVALQTDIKDMSVPIAEFFLQEIVDKLMAAKRKKDRIRNFDMYSLLKV